MQYDKSMAIYDNLDKLIKDFANENSELHKDNTVSMKESFLENSLLKILDDLLTYKFK